MQGLASEHQADGEGGFSKEVAREEKALGDHHWEGGLSGQSRGVSRDK